MEDDHHGSPRGICHCHHVDKRNHNTQYERKRKPSSICHCHHVDKVNQKTHYERKRKPSSVCHCHHGDKLNQKPHHERKRKLSSMQDADSAKKKSLALQDNVATQNEVNLVIQRKRRLKGKPLGPVYRRSGNLEPCEERQFIANTRNDEEDTELYSDTTEDELSTDDERKPVGCEHPWRKRRLKHKTPEELRRKEKIKEDKERIRQRRKKLLKMRLAQRRLKIEKKKQLEKQMKEKEMKEKCKAMEQKKKEYEKLIKKRKEEAEIEKRKRRQEDEKLKTYYEKVRNHKRLHSNKAKEHRKQVQNTRRKMFDAEMTKRKEDIIKTKKEKDCREQKENKTWKKVLHDKRKRLSKQKAGYQVNKIQRKSLLRKRWLKKLEKQETELLKRKKDEQKTQKENEDERRQIESTLAKEELKRDKHNIELQKLKYTAEILKQEYQQLYKTANKTKKKDEIRNLRLKVENAMEKLELAQLENERDKMKLKQINLRKHELFRLCQQRDKEKHTTDYNKMEEHCKRLVKELNMQSEKLPEKTKFSSRDLVMHSKLDRLKQDMKTKFQKELAIHEAKIQMLKQRQKDEALRAKLKIEEAQRKVNLAKKMEILSNTSNKLQLTIPPKKVPKPPIKKKKPPPNESYIYKRNIDSIKEEGKRQKQQVKEEMKPRIAYWEETMKNINMLRRGINNLLNKNLEKQEYDYKTFHKAKKNYREGVKRAMTKGRHRKFYWFNIVKFAALNKEAVDTQQRKESNFRQMYQQLKYRLKIRNYFE